MHFVLYTYNNHYHFHNIHLSLIPIGWWEGNVRAEIPRH